MIILDSVFFDVKINDLLKLSGPCKSISLKAIFPFMSHKRHYECVDWTRYTWHQDMICEEAPKQFSFASEVVLTSPNLEFSGMPLEFFGSWDCTFFSLYRSKEINRNPHLSYSRLICANITSLVFSITAGLGWVLFLKICRYYFLFFFNRSAGSQ
ncbi:hypothetical protein AVEN_23813-1 [Araneus ventricosus]|uniref:Uncharacterized protein n=1 Tax=Araneus ventricosus TaxID=182803 RepID=A0A4Y2JXI2_ARAVE|nr:hypothetical protein AVEN_23813-1 [Araneus ventricosus]